MMRSDGIPLMILQKMQAADMMMFGIEVWKGIGAMME